MTLVQLHPLNNQRPKGLTQTESRNNTVIMRGHLIEKQIILGWLFYFLEKKNNFEKVVNLVFPKN